MNHKKSNGLLCKNCNILQIHYFLGGVITLVYLFCNAQDQTLGKVCFLSCSPHDFTNFPSQARDFHELSNLFFIFQVELLRWFTCFVMLKTKLFGKSLQMYSAKCLVINWWVPKSGLLCPSSYPKSSLMLWKGINYSNFIYLKYNKHRL